MAKSQACQRCRARCVVGATGECLACGHEQRPGADRGASAPSAWGLTVLPPAQIAPSERDGFTDEESA